MVMVPVPLINVHTPVPTVAVLPAKVAVLGHTVWLGPALATVGAAVIVTDTVPADEVHPLTVTVSE